MTREELVRCFNVLAHDLKSPLFSIDGFSDLLLADYKGKLDDEGVDFIRRIRSSAQQMKSVLDQMAHLVKLMSRPLDLRPTDLREVVQELRLRYASSLEKSAAILEFPDDLPAIDVDREMLKELLGILVSNALLYNDRPKGEARVMISVERVDGEFQFQVKDNGIGVDPRYLEQILQLGIKLDKSRGGGAGYGLYLARRIVDFHGGKLTVESAPGEGSTFSFTVPVRPIQFMPTSSI